MVFKKLFFLFLVIASVCVFSHTIYADMVPGGGGGTPDVPVVPDLPDGCLAGTYAQGNSFPSCPAGYYCPGGVPCEKIQCPNGKYTDTIGRAQCDSCPSGQGANPSHTSCVTECEGNFYMVNSQCVQCSGDTYYANENHTGCTACDSGPYYSNTDDVCVQCPDNTPYANESHTGCTACNQPGQAVMNGVCVTCSGTNTPYMNPNGSGCTNCQGVNEWLDGNVCKSCSGTMGNLTFNTNLYQRIHISENTGRAACGIKLKFTGSNASKCKNNSSVVWYVNPTGNTTWVLDDNPVVHATLTSYIKSQYPTSPDGDNADWCEACPNETFNMTDGVGVVSCSVCPSRYCLQNGQCNLCPAGHYCNGSNVMCEDAPLCPKGTFSKQGQYACTECVPGYTTAEAGVEFNDDDPIPCILSPIHLKKAGNTVYDMTFPDNVLSRDTINARFLRKP